MSRPKQWWLNIRQGLWEWLRRNCPEGQILSKPLQIVHSVLFPWATMSFKLHNGIYNPMNDTYMIEGISFSAQFFHALTKADNTPLRLTFKNGYFHIEKERHKDERAKLI